jgi:hypothetical protein
MHHMTKFSIIISQGGNATHKQECNNITKIHGQGGMQKFISQGGMQQYHKNSWTRRNAKIS